MASIALDHKIKSAVAAWREKGYERASPVTQRLLDFWFKEEHWLKDGSEFKFWRAQREAIEALIYVYEVCRYHNLYSLSRNFGVSLTFDPTTDNWPKYCFKMATGSGKTLVMALANMRFQPTPLRGAAEARVVRPWSSMCDHISTHRLLSR